VALGTKPNETLGEIMNRKLLGTLSFVVILVGSSLTVALASGAGAATLSGPAWQSAMKTVQVPGTGCFTSSYPKLQWIRAACHAAPAEPYGFGPGNVGNGHDYSGAVAGSLSSVTGSFDSISKGATESGIQNGSGSPVANTFSLQLNTEFFTTPVCSGHGSNCIGWEQFVYSTTYNEIFIQNWLINYSPPCPSGWFTYSGDCYENSTAASWSGSPLTVGSLRTVQLTGSAVSGGNDTIKMTTSAGTGSAESSDGTVDLAGRWNAAEFGVFGDCCSSKAVFSSGTTVVVRTTLHNGKTKAPKCVVEGFTGETNNLYLAPTPKLAKQSAPTIISEQTFKKQKSPTCSAAAG
jgi:hypothetical protein